MWITDLCAVCSLVDYCVSALEYIPSCQLHPQSGMRRVLAEL